MAAAQPSQRKYDHSPENALPRGPSAQELEIVNTALNSLSIHAKKLNPINAFRSLSLNGKYTIKNITGSV